MRTCLLALVAVLIAGCARHSEVITLYERPGPHMTYQHVFVVGIAGDSNARRMLESRIAEELTSVGTRATPAYRETHAGTTLLQEDIDAAVSRTGADAILVTHLASVDTEAEFEEGRVDVVSECRRGDPADYFLYDYSELKLPDTVRFAHTVVAISNLYDAADGERLWTIQSTCFRKETMAEVLFEEARVIARQLRTDRLVE